MTDASINTGFCAYLIMLNKGIIQNGLGGAAYKKGRIRKTKNLLAPVVRRRRNAGVKNPDWYPGGN